MMQLAQTLDGEKIAATAQAPKEAICPYCGGELILRSRKGMNNGKSTYYWRHHSNQNRHCSARYKAVT